jgi:hypothetical protein
MKTFWIAVMFCCGAWSASAAEPETVVVTLHAKPGAEAELARVIANHWDTARKLNLVQTAPHVTLRGDENGKTYFIEIFTWRDGSIPDAVPAEIQAIWKQMNDLVEALDGKPGLDFRAVSVVAAGP